MSSLGPLGNYKMEWLVTLPALDAGVVEPIDLAGRISDARRVTLTAGVEYQFKFEPLVGTTGDVSSGLYGPKPAKPLFTYGTRADSIAGSDVWGEQPTGWQAGQGIEEFLFTPTLSGEYLWYLYCKRSAGAGGEIRYFPTSLLGVGDAAQGSFSAAWPSPARPGQIVRFRVELSTAAPVRLMLVDSRGRVIRHLWQGTMAAGVHVPSWDGRTDDGALAPAGLYFARLERPAAAGGDAVRRVVWVR
jgi:hypothetical protein